MTKISSTSWGVSTLLLAYGQVRDVSFGFDLETVCFGQFTDSFRYDIQIKPRFARGFEAQGYVFGYSQVINQHEMLVNHANTLFDRIGGRVDLNRLAVE